MEVWTIYPLLAGLLGALVMAVIFRGEPHAHLTSFHLTRAIGGAFTKKFELGRRLGLMLHLLYGAIFGYFYAYIFSIAPAPAGNPLIVTVITCALFGMAHGVLSGMMVLIVFKEAAKLERFKLIRPLDFVAYVVAFLGYGLTVGLVLGLTL